MKLTKKERTLLLDVYNRFINYGKFLAKQDDDYFYTHRVDLSLKEHAFHHELNAAVLHVLPSHGYSNYPATLINALLKDDTGASNAKS